VSWDFELGTPTKGESLLKDKICDGSNQIKIQLSGVKVCYA